MQSLKFYLYLGAKNAFMALIITVIAALVMRVLEIQMSKKHSRKKKYLILFALWYTITLLQTVFIRTAPGLSPGAVYNLYPLESLFNALSSEEFSGVFQLVFNGLMFLPAGALIFILFADRKRALKWLVGLSIPLLIEVVQFITGLGILDIDDLIANCIGELWGYWIGKAFHRVKAKHPRAYLTVTVSAAPVLVCAAALIYFLCRPYGFIRADFVNQMYSFPNSVKLEESGYTLPDKVCFYTVESFDRSETIDAVDSIFAAIGLTRNPDISDIYDTLSVYWANNSNAYIHFYTDGSFDFHIPNGMEFNGDIAENIMDLLDKVYPGIASAEYTCSDNTILIETGAENRDSRLGSVEWKESGGMVKCIKSGVCRAYGSELNSCGMDKLKSRLLQGKFQYLIQPERAVEDNWTCSILRIDTIKDSFGCLRPVYILDVCDGIESFQIAVSAIA